MTLPDSFNNEGGERNNQRPASYYRQDRKSYAFNLKDEAFHIKKLGPEGLEYFKFQAHTYADEAFGNVKNAPYEHSIAHDSNGHVQLMVPMLGISAKESYKEPLNFKTGLSQWYLNRVHADLQTVDTIERFLTEAEATQETPIIIDPSPAPFDVPLEERRENGFGTQSFLRVHMRQGDNLKSIAMRHYLDGEGQKELVNRLTGITVDNDALLSYAGKAKPEVIFDINDPVQIAYVQSVIDDIYEHTPPERKIIPAEDDTFFHNEQEVKKIIRKGDLWLKDIFETVWLAPETNGELKIETQQDVVRQFRGWENAIRDLLKKYKYNKEYSDVDFDTLENRLYYESQEYFASKTGCGEGSGGFEEHMHHPYYQDSLSANKDGGLFDNRSLVEYSDKSYRHPDYACPGCGTVYKGEVVGSDRSTWLKQCKKEDCKYDFDC